MDYKIVFEYVYSFYSFGEELETKIGSEEFSVGCRFKLDGQEDGSFVIDPVKVDNLGAYAILTFPNKDRMIVREGDSCEFIYDEFFDAMGDSNHNVYVGAVSLKSVKL